MKKLFTLLLIILLLAFGATWFLLPSMVRDGLEAYLVEEIPMHDLTVELADTNTFDLLSGKINRAEADGTEVVMDNLTYDEINLELKQVEFDLETLVFDKKFIVKKIAGGEISATLTEAEVQNYLHQEITNIDNIQVAITPRQIEIAGNIDVAGFLSGEIKVAGELLLTDNILMVRPTGVQFNSMGISGLTSAIMKPIEIYDFRKFPIPVTANKVDMLDGKVRVTAVPHKE